ncbi:aldo/keto reductase [Pseudorhodoferax sp. Leaf274]|uniref:aldo/keto reductase n=1 Tax=Pseudorhodoferax sp. Leaf274 TaxID=1736318 RepID=UPI000702423D|nr:aldo/keto reductase [Pseudorhodoferax sp. Leaf274]KQP45110.1 aldo/keto reductase [Pseudorhodoferax sp. Leaf274]
MPRSPHHLPDPPPGPPSTARRALLRAAAACLSLSLVRPAGAQATPAALLTRPVPSSGDALPVVGLGSWITFNVGDDPQGRAAAAAVVQAFFAAGGRLIDSSPMYGSAQQVIGHALAGLQQPPLYAADKVWTRGAARGADQIAASQAHWRLARPFDLLQVHNLLDWETQLPRLFEMKAAGRLRHVGITTSEGRRHREFEAIMDRHPLDFVQFSYNLLDREAEQRLLPLAAERGIAVLVNRPFRQGALLQQLQRHPLPGWAAEIGCRHWAQVALKFVVSHPAVTCAIPATSQVAHLRQNMDAARGPLPDAALRRRMAGHVAAL